MEPLEVLPFLCISISVPLCLFVCVCVRARARVLLFCVCVQAKFRALQDVLLHESLACGDGTTLSQKDWNALPVQLKRVRVNLAWVCDMMSLYLVPSPCQLHRYLCPSYLG